MNKCFYFICPTDCLEHTINKSFKYENYFYSSLGNSCAHDFKSIIYLSKMIKKHNIKEISFVLSMDNKIILDALEKQEFSNIGVLHNFYNEIAKQKKYSEILYTKENGQFLILSYYLNKKIKELQLLLTNLLNEPIKIGGKIYNKPQNSFTKIYPDLVCLEKYHLN